MNWKKEAQEKLKNYEIMRLATINLPQEIARLEIDAEAIRGANYENAPVRCGVSRREEALMSNIIHRQELNRALQQAQLWVSTTDRALGVLNHEQKQILKKLYMYPQEGAIPDLCEELGLEQSSIYRKRDIALRKFTMAYYGLT